MMANGFSQPIVTKQIRLYFFVDYENQADFNIYFADYKNKAGWRNKSKQYLMF